MIWCVEDDNNIRDIEVYTLNSTGFQASGLKDGNSLWRALDKETPELILLDIMLPDEDGIEILRKLKSNFKTCDIPVIMATAKGEEYDKIHGLDLGADDYLTKPFGMMEMVSRVKAVLRRCGSKPEDKIIKFDELSLNIAKRQVSINGEIIVLTYKEFELLMLFMKHESNVFTRENLFNTVWGENYIGESRTLDMHIKTLRQKLKAYGSCIKTVRNIGYKMERTK